MFNSNLGPYLFDSQEIRLNPFGGGNESKMKELYRTGRLNLFDFLGLFASHKEGLLKSILSRIDFKKFKGNLIVDITMPSYVGGYWDLKDTIAINPMLLLFGSEKAIAHVLIHEAIHAGAYTDGVEVHDESITETLAKKKMVEEYSETGFASGYDDMVVQLKQYFGDLSFEQITEKIESGDEETFDNFLEIMVLNPMFEDNNANEMTWDNVEFNLKKKWKIMKELFPRIINSIHDREVGPHEDATMDVSHFKLEGLLEKCANRIVNDQPERLADILVHITKGNKEVIDSLEVQETLMKQGYAYLVDFGGDKITQYINHFVNIYNSFAVVGNAVDMKFVAKSMLELELDITSSGE